MIISKNAEKKQVCEDYVYSPNAHDHAHTYADGATHSHARNHGAKHGTARPARILTIMADAR